MLQADSFYVPPAKASDQSKTQMPFTMENLGWIRQNPSVFWILKSNIGSDVMMHVYLFICILLLLFTVVGGCDRGAGCDGGVCFLLFCSLLLLLFFKLFSMIVMC